MIPLWDRDEIQFPRLICEILATIEITDLDWANLREAMDLEDEELESLFTRAQVAWEKAKSEHTPVRP